ncbi:hypothetical protein BDY24DRAFT_74844 [Mrakia frigida]|uniref:uncharacterized protein n=1 Tax=Mrakia frigida TaxID=29902 RepID=UPI003FCBF633
MDNSEEPEVGGGEEERVELEGQTMRERLDATNWSKTSLGPRESWAPALSTLVEVVLKMTELSCLWWRVGSELDWVLIHNDAYQRDLGTDEGEPHFGRLASQCYDGALWESIKERASAVQLSGKARREDDGLFFFRGIETYFTWEWTPVDAGILVTCYNSTSQYISKRWLAMQRDLVHRLTPSRSIGEFSDGVMKSLEANERDIPWALLYRLQTETSSGEAVDLSQEGSLLLSGSVGLPLDHDAAPRTADISLGPQSSSSASSSHPWVFRNAVEEAWGSSVSLVVADATLRVPEPLRYRCWGEETSKAVVLKISNKEDATGSVTFLIIGLNPRRRFDSTYKSALEDFRLLVLGSLKSITAYDAERRKNVQMQSIEKAKTLFFSSVSHEFRTPLQLISGPLTDLEASETDSRRKSSFNLVLRNTSRLIRLVDSLMDFSLIEGGRMVGKFVPSDLSSMTADLASHFRPAIEKAKLTLKVECEPDPQDGRVVYVDADFWEKIVFNLLGNAFKYTIIGGITVKLSFLPEEVEFSIVDSGVGIPKSDISIVCERFHRVASVSRSHEGTGIGLSLCAELVNLHGGRLEIDSETVEESVTGDSGSTFSVFLPYGRGHLPASQTSDSVEASVTRSFFSRGVIDEVGRWSGGSTSNSTGGSESGVSMSEASSGKDLTTLFWNKATDSILIVDDSADMRVYLTSILSRYCKVITASNGEEALALAIASPPDLIISDISMPKLDGLGLLEAIRGHERTEVSYIPLILVTAKAGQDDRVAGLLAGAEDFLSKPFSTKELVARAHLQMQLGKKRIEMERNFRDQEAATRLLSDSSPTGISRWNAAGELIYVNDAWFQQNGHPRDKDLSLWLESVHPDHISRLERIYVQLFVEKDVGNGWEWQWANGTWCFCQAAIVSDSNQSLVGTLCVLTDITDRKRLEEERVSSKLAPLLLVDAR